MSTFDLSSNLKVLSLDMIERAKSGHPGVSLGISDMLAVLAEHINLSTSINRDRLVFSGGHASSVIYAFMHLMGFDISMDDLKSFRKFKAKTSGHPERDLKCGIETTTGPLGQGIANSVGLAIAQRYYQENIKGAHALDHKIYCFCGDGDLQEGISYESASLAGHLGLQNLILIYDCNKITIDGDISLTFSDDVATRFRAQHWSVLEIDGHNFEQIQKAIIDSKNATKPTLIIANTKIAKGAFEAEGSNKAHGAPLGATLVSKIKESLGFVGDFEVKDSVRDHCASLIAKNEAKALEFERENKELVELFKDCELEFEAPYFEIGRHIATRTSNGEILKAISRANPQFLGGSADLGSSNGTLLESASFPMGKNIYFGIREHAMGAITNGIAAYGGLLPFCSTFFVFSDYLSHSIRLASLMRLRVFYIFTHDSIGVGEDGPTHHPIEHLSHYRAIPNLRVYRPMDANENILCMKSALAYAGPSMFVLSRQELEVLSEKSNLYMDLGFRLVYDSNSDEEASTLSIFNEAIDKACCQNDAKCRKIIILSSGSEVACSIEAAKLISCDVKVYSVFCFELMLENIAELKELCNGARVLAVEASRGLEWWRVADDVLCMESFGESGSGEELFEHFGFDPKSIAKRALEMLS